MAGEGKHESKHTISAGEFSSRVITVKLNIHFWEAKVRSKKGRSDVKQANGGKDKNYKVEVLLVDRDEIQPLIDARRELRDFYNKATLPWQDGGIRILRLDNYSAFRARFNELADKLNHEADVFAAKRDVFLQRLKDEIGELADEVVFPSEQQIRSKYGVELEEDFVSSPAAARLEGVPEEVAEQIREDVVLSLSRRTQGAVRSLIQSILQITQRIGGVDEVNDAKGLFRDAFADTLKDLVPHLATLNLTGDPRLEDLIYRIQNNLATLGPDELRTALAIDEAKSIQKEAKTILSELDDFFFDLDF